MMLKSLVISFFFTGNLAFSLEGENCELVVTDLKYPPIITDQNLEFIPPILSSDEETSIPLENGQEVLFSCPGTEFESGFGTEGLIVRCDGGQNLEVWSNGAQKTEWRDMGCKKQPKDEAEVIGTCGGSDNNAILIRIGFQVHESSIPEVDPDVATIVVCHDQTKSATLWAMHSLWDEISAQQHGNDRPDFKKDTFYSYDVNQAYTRDDQIAALADLVGSEDLANDYIHSSGNTFLARGHLAPNADFAYFSLMDSTFHFVNVAPQWQNFNGGNWMYFETGVRDFVVERNIDAIVYTGTHGIMELAHVNGNMVEIYLFGGNQLPVPRYFWKIIYDEERNEGVAVIGINNPHIQEDEILESYILCPPLEDAAILSPVYNADNNSKGYMYACRVEDLAFTVPEVPDLPLMDLLN